MREAVRRNHEFLGVCLGAQLLALARDGSLSRLLSAGSWPGRR